jgi:integrase
MAALRERKSVPDRALEFLILTASRTSPVRGAVWDEIDLATATWTIPGARMKSGQPHRVPLSDAVVALLKALPREDGNSHVFVGANSGQGLSPSMLQRALARIRDNITVHGFRSTFRDWAGERTGFPFEVLEKALAHSVGNKASRAYARSDLLAERAKLMAAWSAFCGSPPAEGTVVPLRAAARP